MAGKPRHNDEDTNTALLLVEQEKLVEETPRRQQEERERLITQCSKAIGQIQTSNMFAKFAAVSSLVWLKQVKENKTYRDVPSVGTWEKFCESVGMSRQKVDEDLMNLATFGETFLTTCQQLSVGYRELRKLRQLTHDGTVVIDAEAVEIGGERVPLTPDHKEDLQAMIEKVIDEKEKALTDAKATVKAKDRVLESKEQEIQKLHKELSKLETKAAEKGLTADEDAFLTQLNNSRMSFEGNMLQVDPLRMPELRNESNPPTHRMIAAYLAELAYRRAQINAAFDTAHEMYSVSGMFPEEEWMPGKGAAIPFPE